VRRAEHVRMVHELCKCPQILANALNEDEIHIRCTECIIDNDTQEKADIVFQNKPIAVWSGNTICYVAEVKSEKGDHEILGQLEKSVDAIRRGNQTHKLYSEVRGIAIVKEFTKSGLSLLNKYGYLAFEWKETESEIHLFDSGNNVDFSSVIIRKPVVGTPNYTEVDRKILLETNFMVGPVE